MGFMSSIFGGEKTETTGMKMGASTETVHQHAVTVDTAKEKDPVCGMDVDPNTAAGKSEYMGKTYYFCAPGCKKEFDNEPEKYLKAANKQMSGHNHGGGHCC